MVGGSTRVPLVAEMVKSFFKREPMNDLDPDQVVAIGAAIQADVLCGNSSDGKMSFINLLYCGMTQLSREAGLTY